MRHLRWQWPFLKQQLAQAPHVLLLLDFDGTLAPIVDRPADARLLPESAAALRRLSSLRSCTLGFLSGRPLADLRRLVSLPACYYAGNCGIEWEGPGFGPLRGALSAAAREQLRDTRELLARQIGSFPGAFVEDKGFSIAIHYRLVSPRLIAQLENCLASFVATLAAGLRASPGKMALDIRPAGAPDKGSAVRAISRRVERTLDAAPLTLFFGDDECDEAAFESVGPFGWPVFVGRPEAASHAACYVEGPREVADFLGRVGGCLTGGEILRPRAGAAHSDAWIACGTATRLSAQAQGQGLAPDLPRSHFSTG